jgi:hypothetical protein
VTIIATVHGPVMEVTIDRPKAMNALANEAFRVVWNRFISDPALWLPS